MKKYLYQIGLFVVILFIVNLLLFNLGNELYYKNYDKYSLNFNNYLFSDSHGDPLGQYTEQYGVYNFSAGSDSYLDIKRKINFLIEKTSIDTIYLSGDEHMLSPYREKLNNIDKSAYYTTVNDYKTTLEYYKNKISQKVIYFQPRTGTVIRKYFISKIENIFTSSQLEKNKEVSSELNWTKKTLDSKEVIVRNRFKNQFFFNKNSTLLEDALLEIIDICKSNQIAVIGVKFPLTKEYYSLVKDKSFEVDSIFKVNNLKVLDFQSKYINNGHLFIDGDHLSIEGGKLFSEILFNESPKL